MSWAMIIPHEVAATLDNPHAFLTIKARLFYQYPVGADGCPPGLGACFGWRSPMERAIFRAVNPVLPARDVRAAVEFYVTRLGFTLRGFDVTDDPRYAVIRRDDVVLHLQWHDPAEWSAVERPMLRFVVLEV